MCQSYIRNVINIFQHKRTVLRLNVPPRCRVILHVPDRCRAIRRHCGRGAPRKRPATLPVSPDIAACRASAIPAAASRNQLQQARSFTLPSGIRVNRILEDRGCLRALTPQPRHLFQSDLQFRLGFVELTDHFLVRILRHDG